MQPKRRNGYIDIMKFILALIVAEFHLESGLFPGGRVAVEGFYMISAYLMMKNLARDKYPQDSLGVATVRFTAGKYKALLQYLLPSVIIGYIVYARMEGRTMEEFLRRAPLLLFEIVPLRTTGIRGIHVVGISWYLSAMFLALAILYPLCRKFRRNFTLVWCPLIFLFAYGFVSETYESIAVTSGFMDGALFSSGMARALGSSAAGCLLFEIGEALEGKRFTLFGRITFTALELAGFRYLFYAMHNHPRSKYDFVLVFLMFGLLIIGLNSLSFTALLLRGRWTKFFGTCSTLIVLNHYYWCRYLPQILGEEYYKTDKVWHYVAAVALSGALVYAAGQLVGLVLNKGGRLFLAKPQDGSC